MRNILRSYELLICKARRCGVVVRSTRYTQIETRRTLDCTSPSSTRPHAASYTSSSCTNRIHVPSRLDRRRRRRRRRCRPSNSTAPIRRGTRSTDSSSTRVPAVLHVTHPHRRLLLSTNSCAVPTVLSACCGVDEVHGVAPEGLADAVDRLERASATGMNVGS